jgi:two-component system nitrogen regulation sensor histidine kinase NtrY
MFALRRLAQYLRFGLTVFSSGRKPRAEAKPAARAGALIWPRFLKLSWSRLARYTTLGLALLGLASGTLTYLILSNLTPITPNREVVWTLLSVNLFIISGLFFVLVMQALRLRRRRREGKAGAYMHGRMVVLFSIITTVPAILVAIFAIVMMNRGLDYWFSARTKTIIGNTTAVANAYISEQRNGLQSDLTAMAKDLSKARALLTSDPASFTKFLRAQAGLRKMPQALVIDDKGRVRFQALPEQTILTSLPPREAFVAANSNTVVMSDVNQGQILALRKIQGSAGLYVYGARILSDNVVQQLRQTDAAVRDYSAMEKRRFETQLTFALVYIVMTLVILLSAIWLGLALADRLVMPISRLIYAARRLGEGELKTRVSTETMGGNDEIEELAWTFNEMAERIGAQQEDLMEAHKDLDVRARFTETILQGVSSGVVGVSGQGIIRHANQAAGALYDKQPHELVGKKISQTMPEFAELVANAKARQTLVTGQVSRQDAGKKGHIIQASASVIGGSNSKHSALVLTFDDITDLLTAQRNAAWADIARRIAHEIKNPLTPIQLSAERLQSKYGDGIGETKDIFKKCTETIIRQVEDIGRMVDEFAEFARMPLAVMDVFDVSNVVSQAVLLQRVAFRDIDYHVECPETLNMYGDRRLISQMLTNVLKNAAEALQGQHSDKRIALTIKPSRNHIYISVSDTGPGWPEGERHALLEPYNTSREAGTGLGLSIVKKVIEDHGAKLSLEDASWSSSGGTGAKVQMEFPLQTQMADTPKGEKMAGVSKELEEL